MFLNQSRDYIRSKIVEAKLASVEENEIKNLEKEIITADSPIPFSLKQLWFDLDDFERKTYLKDRTTECIVKEGESGKIDIKRI